MKIQVLQQDRPVELTIISTQKGRTALTTDEPTPRERQLLLLLDKGNSELSRQGVSILLAKLDLNKLSKKGWVEYFVFDSPDVGMQAGDDVEKVEKVTKKSKKNTNIQNFLNEYSHKDDDSTFSEIVTPKPVIIPVAIDDTMDSQFVVKDKVSINTSAAPIMISDILDEGIESLSKEPILNDDFEDIVILQSLLN